MPVNDEMFYYYNIISLFFNGYFFLFLVFVVCQPTRVQQHLIYGYPAYIPSFTGLLWDTLRPLLPQHYVKGFSPKLERLLRMREHSGKNMIFFFLYKSE